MRIKGWILATTLIACGGGDESSAVDASAPPSDGNSNNGADASMADARIGPDAMPNQQMTFFATSVGTGAMGGNLGGLAGADAKCQNLATIGGAGTRTWRAYLSTGNTGPGPVGDARDRIGSGPWHNQKGEMVAADLTSLHQNGILGSLILDELGNAIPGNEHDILTGSNADGTLSDDYNTCSNWTDGTTEFQRTVGHSDSTVENGESWNSVHTGACDEASLNNHAGTGRIYCFAID